MRIDGRGPRLVHGLKGPPNPLAQDTASAPSLRLARRVPARGGEDRLLAATRPSMRIAAIDLGSNSFHMVVVEVNASGGFRVVAAEKEMVRLGAGTVARGRLSAAAMGRGLEVLREYKRLAEAQGAEKILAVATSAIREAANGEDFLRRVGREIRIWPRAITGETEARFIYLAALHSIHLEGQRALVVDIGGGSVELALGAGSQLRWAVSEKLGVLRMSQRFVRSDPLSRRDGQRLADHVGETVAPHVDRIAAEGGFERVIGTSGTILALGAMAHQMETGAVAPVLHHVTVRADTLHELRGRLVAAGLRDRLKMPGVDAQRADILVAGAVIFDTILERVGAKDVVLCEWALREGLLLNYIHGHPRTLARRRSLPRRAPAQRGGAGRAVRLRRGSRAARRRSRAVPLRQDRAPSRAQGARPGSPWARGAAPRHRSPHLLPRPPQALLLPHQERGTARLPSRGGRASRQCRPLPPPGTPPKEARGIRLVAPRLAASGTGAGRLPAGGRRPRPLAPPGSTGPQGE